MCFIVFLYVFLVCDTWTAVVCIDNSAFLETVFLQDVLHYIVVMMCVYAYVVMLLKAPSDALVCNSFLFPVGGHAVNHTVWGIIQPFAIIDNRIGRVFSDNETEGSYRLSLLILAYVAVSVGYLAEDVFLTGIAVYPLVGIAVLLNELA